MAHTSISEILKILLKDLAIQTTVTSLAKEIGLSRVGTWKLLKRMQSENLISLSRIGSGKTSVYSAGLNWDNPVVEKTLAVALTEDALRNQRWMNNFAGFEGNVDFLILYGSSIKSPDDANDIDIVGVTSGKNKFVKIKESVRNAQKTQIKKIHSINFTPAEFMHELRKQNKAFVDAVKKGIVLFGQEKFVEFMRRMATNDGKRSR